MKKYLLAVTALFLAGMQTNAQIGVGVKAGLNFANVTGSASFTPENRTGFMFGGYFSPKSTKTIGFRTELLFSRQGYDYKTATNTGNVNLDYLLMPQLLVLNFGKSISLQAGGQIAFLLNAKADSSGTGTSSPYGQIADYMNRVDYGFVVGAEIAPVKGLIIGARYNKSLGELYKSVTYSGGTINFADPDFKNNVVQVYAGWRF